MLATNVIDSMIGGKWGPVDGYRVVVEKAIELLHATPEQAIEMGVSDSWIKNHTIDDDEMKELLDRLFKSSKARKASKSVCMPLVYGAKLPSMISSVRRNLKDDYKLDLKKEFIDRVKPDPEHPDDRSKDISCAFEMQNQIVTEMTCYFYQAACLVYPKVMQALKWLEALAGWSIKGQLEEHKRQHDLVNEEAKIQFLADENNSEDDWTDLPVPAFMPKIEWTLSDGTVCSYWETKLETKEVKSLEFGRYLQAVGAGENPDVAAMIRAFAPGWTHSMDALLLRTALQDWDIEELGPITSIHDCLKCLPSALTELRNRLQAAMKQVIADNPIHQLAEQMQVPLELLPELELGEGDLNKIGRHLFH